MVFQTNYVYIEIYENRQRRQAIHNFHEYFISIFVENIWMKIHNFVSINNNIPISDTSLFGLFVCSYV